MRMMAPLLLLLAALAPAALAPPDPVADRVRAAAAPAGLPRYERVLVLDAAKDPAANVSIGDLDGDGHLDMLLVKGRHWPGKSRVFLLDGKGHIRSSHDLAETAYRSYSGRLVDLDGDGDLDVVLSNDAPDPKVVYLNDGKGGFRLGSSFGLPQWETRNAAVADLDGDGRPDIVAANRSEHHRANYVCLNRGKGAFDADCTAFSQESATTITPADFNHDGRIDLAVPNRDGGQSWVYLAGPGAAFSSQRRIPFGPADATIRMAEAADLDGDGVLDIVTIDEKRGAAVYFGKKDGSFAPGMPLDDGKATPYALTVGDLNLDGKIDIVVGHVEAPSTIFFNAGGGRRYTPVHFGDRQGAAYGFAIADLDGNGLPDIAVARSDASSLVYFADPPPAGAR